MGLLQVDRSIIYILSASVEKGGLASLFLFIQNFLIIMKLVYVQWRTDISPD